MRAAFLENTFTVDDVDKVFKIESDQARHLIKVIRIKKNEKILILNGKGSRVIACVIHVDRRELSVKLESVDVAEDSRRISLFLGIPKKEAFESIVKMSSEIGIKEIFLYRSRFSQQDVEVNERILKIEESAMLQSNNPYRMKFTIVENYRDVLNHFDLVVNFSTFTKGDLVEIKAQNVLMMIGPEAGFCEDEEDSFNSQPNVVVCKMSTNILRAPTALAVGSGYILSKF